MWFWFQLFSSKYHSSLYARLNKLGLLAIPKGDPIILTLQQLSSPRHQLLFGLPIFLWGDEWRLLKRQPAHDCMRDWNLRPPVHPASVGALRHCGSHRSCCRQSQHKRHWQWCNKQTLSATWYFVLVHPSRSPTVRRKISRIERNHGWFSCAVQTTRGRFSHSWRKCFGIQGGHVRAKTSSPAGRIWSWKGKT